MHPNQPASVSTTLTWMRWCAKQSIQGQTGMQSMCSVVNSMRRPYLTEPTSQSVEMTQDQLDKGRTDRKLAGCR